MFLSKIAIIRRNGLGDVLCGIPLVLLCKKMYPDAHVTLFIDERAAPLAPYLEGPDTVVVIPEHKSKYWGHFKAVWGKRHKKFDLAISAKSSPMKLMNLFLYGLQAKQRIAYVDTSWHSKLINCPVAYDCNAQTHQALRSLYLLDRHYTTVPKEFYPRLRVTSQLALEPCTLLISVTNNRLGSTLDPEKYGQILNRLYGKRNFNIVVSGESKDLGRAHEVVSGLKMPSRILLTDHLSDFLPLLSSVDALLIGDGGVMHLAAALDKKQVALFGGTKVREWSPLSEKAICLADERNVNFIPEDKILEAVEKMI